jgi:hypothetical protein
MFSLSQLGKLIRRGLDMIAAVALGTPKHVQSMQVCYIC